MNKLVKPHLQVMRSVSVGQPPTIPDTEGVNEMLALAGPTATLMDVAKGILDRLVERPELEVQVEEMLFLKDCLGASLETLAMPCMLLQRNTGDVTPGRCDYLMIYAKQVNTSSSCPGTPGSRSRTPSVAFSRPPPSWESLDARMLDEFDQWDFDSFELAEATKGNPLHFAGWKALDGFLGEQSALRVMALHAMDISNPAKVFSLSDKWSDLLRQEFFLQGDEEKHLGLPISPLCDRETVRFASSQVGFFTIIVQPTFTLMAELQHRVKDVLLTHLQTNTEAWEARKKKEQLGEMINV
ncbi:unnamed protein product [Durusdinium trenchii]|uniref:PDEase domain-containing protein n=1 Tax=Durusdinium trenchii TaxID=1381693 RepID=A0ABP0JGJ7_9DINO